MAILMRFSLCVISLCCGADCGSVSAIRLYITECISSVIRPSPVKIGANWLILAP